MSTVGKALSLLELFSIDAPEVGLTELSRLSGFDKATTRRLLMALGEHGFVEQDVDSRMYRLGPGLTRLARLREERLPFLQTSLPVIRGLAEETAETVHLSEASNGLLRTVYVEHPPRANRVNVNVGEELPLHSTASGIAFLAAARPAHLEAALSRALPAFTPHTVTDPERLRISVDEARDRGWSRSEQGYEEGVFSVGAAILGADGFAIGTLAIAAPLVRCPEEIVADRGQAVATAAGAITERLNGGRVEITGRERPAVRGRRT